MNDMDKSLSELLGMLITTVKNIDKGKRDAILMVKRWEIKNNHKKPNKFMGKGKGKGKETFKPKIKTHALKPLGGMVKESNCFYFDMTRHWD